MTEWQIGRIRIHAGRIAHAAHELLTLADAAEIGFKDGIPAPQWMKDDLLKAMDHLYRHVGALKEETP
jgi:hypothetical protein